MRNEDEQLRHYTPLLRRIILIVAVLTAVPVILWSITAFVRGYVGPPQLPSYRPIAATESVQSESMTGTAAPTGERTGQPTPATQPSTASDSTAPVVEARATATDSRGAPPANAPMLGDRLSGATPDPWKPAADAQTLGNSPPPADPDASAKMRFAERATPDSASTGALGAQSMAMAEPSPDALPAAPPLTGRIPLPPHRPRQMVMAMSAVPGAPAARAAVPLPRPRPGAASPAAATETPASGPLDWLQGVFQAHP